MLIGRFLHRHRWDETQFADGVFPDTFVYRRRCRCGAERVGAAFTVDVVAPDGTVMRGLWGDGCPTVREPIPPPHGAAVTP